VLEFGDRVGVLAHRADFAAMRKYFGDSIKGTAEFSYISIGIGMALGFLIGAIQLPLPGIGKLSVGLAGVLIMALILGKLRRTGRHELDHSAFRQSRDPQPGPHALPRASRDGLGS
jgi:putative transport protein